MKKGKEIKLATYNNYVLSYGTVDNKNPKAFYIEMSAWLEPLEDRELNYTRVIGNLNKKIKQSLFDYIDEDILIKNMSIIDLDIRESGVEFGRRSFMNCEITLFQVNPKPINTPEIQMLVEDLIREVVENAFNTNKYFKFHQKKNSKQLEEHS